MAEEKEKPKRTAGKATVRINRVDENIDEVFIYSEDPYINRAIHAKTGLFKVGEFPLDEIEKKEEQSKPKANPDLGKIEPAAGK